MPPRATNRFDPGENWSHIMPTILAAFYENGEVRDIERVAGGQPSPATLPYPGRSASGRCRLASVRPRDADGVSGPSASVCTSTICR